MPDTRIMDFFDELIPKPEGDPEDMLPDYSDNYAPYAPMCQWCGRYECYGQCTEYDIVD